MILTVDYEVFGNGTGCINPCVLEPAERISQIAKRYSAPITFFVEALEFQAMETHLACDRVREQLAAFLEDRHDIQLHIHPQWSSAVRIEERWRLDMERWRIGDLPYDEVFAMLAEGKSWLEELAAQADRNYRCIAFRAGGWCIQPSGFVVTALLDLGFAIESTVAPGFRNARPGEWCDFRRTPAASHWKTRGDVCNSESGGIIEVPIVTGTIDPLRHLKAVQRARSQNGGFAPGCKGSYLGADGFIGRVKGKASRLAGLGRVMLDLSTMPADVLIEITGQWLEKHSQDAIAPLPLVAIAHTKNFTRSSESAMAEYLAWAKTAGVKFSTYGGWLESCNASG